MARRDATLVAFLLATAEDLVDQALDMHDKLLGQQFKKGERKQEDHIKKSRKAHEVRNEVVGGGKEAPLLFPLGVNAC